MNQALKIYDRLPAIKNEPMFIPFISIGYDFVRIAKEFSQTERNALKSKCDVVQEWRDNKEVPVYYLRSDCQISFIFHSDEIHLLFNASKIIRRENVQLATPKEVYTALDKVQRKTGLNFFDGEVRELHFTITLQTREPFEQYRELIQAPKRGYEKEIKNPQPYGDYYNSTAKKEKLISILVYDKANEWLNTYGEYPAPLKEKFYNTDTPNLFRFEIKLKGKIRRTLMRRKVWNTDYDRFTADVLTDVKQYYLFHSFLLKELKRFMIKTTTPLPKDADESVRAIITALEIAPLTVLHDYGIISKRGMQKAERLKREGGAHERKAFVLSEIDLQVQRAFIEYEAEVRRMKRVSKMAMTVNDGIRIIVTNNVPEHEEEHV